MTKKELIEAIKDYPDDMLIFIDERITEFNFGLLNSVSKQHIGFSEDAEGEILATGDVIILSEE